MDVTCKPIVEDPFTEKKLESKLRTKYQVNLLNKPQHLAKIKAPKLLKFPSKRITNLRKRKFKNNELKLRENKQKVREKCPRQFSNVKVRVLRHDYMANGMSTQEQKLIPLRPSGAGLNFIRSHVE